jgi:hypothetical protein
MKPSGVVVSVVFAAIALALVVWVGRYQAEPPSLSGTKPAEVGPPISPTGPHPKAVAEETEFDFGVMPVYGKGKHEYVIRNEGEADLVLMARKEDTTCSCTFGELSKDGSIKPGESVKVTLQWEIKAMTDQFRHRAIVRTNDPENKTIELVVSGRVDETMRLLPSGSWSLGQLSSTEPNVMSGQLFSAILDSFEITGVTTSRDTTKVEWTPMTAEELDEKKVKSGYNVTVTLPPDVAIGPYADNVKLATSVENFGEIAFDVKGQRPGPLEFLGPGYHPEASVLLMGEFPAAQGKESVLSLFVRDLEQELTLEDLKLEHNAVQVSLEKDEKFVGKTQRYLVKVKVPPGPPQDRQRKKSEKVDLFLNHPEAKQVRLIIDFLAV